MMCQLKVLTLSFHFHQWGPLKAFGGPRSAKTAGTYTKTATPTPNLLSAEVLSRKMAGAVPTSRPPSLVLTGILVWALLWAINFKKPCFGRKAVLSPALGFPLDLSG